MLTELLDYHLPERAIAQRPSPEREHAKLLVVNAAGVEHRRFADFGSLIPEGALLVLNDTRVRRARLRCRRPSGGAVELLLLERLNQTQGAEEWTALGRPNRALSEGARVELAGAHFTVIRREPTGEIVVRAEGHGDMEAFLAAHGRTPLPPYIKRPADDADDERYQTVFAAQVGSAAAPTAGLHLTQALLGALAARGVQIGYVTLHIGLGTFAPVRCDDLDQHPMHAEPFEVSEVLAEQIAAARQRGAPVVAVGTTVVRALESARDPGRAGHVRACSEWTRLLIQPGHDFGVVDALLTNFHAPRSTLIALVSAFAGQRRCAAAYATALGAGYRFLSYGDAMWLPARLPEDLPRSRT